jgi:hypothetical protein
MVYEAGISFLSKSVSNRIHPERSRQKHLYPERPTYIQEPGMNIEYGWRLCIMHQTLVFVALDALQLVCLAGQVII